MLIGGSILLVATGREIKMRLLLLACGVLFFAGTINAQSEPTDPYSLNLVKSVMKLNSGGQKFILTTTQKGIYRLGDCISIAIIKTLNEQDLSDPVTVKAFLPLIRQAFDQPQLISRESDKTPKLTIFLLKSLLQDRKST